MVSTSATPLSEANFQEPGTEYDPKRKPVTRDLLLRMDLDAFNRAVMRVANSAAKEDSRPILTNVRFQLVGDGTINMVGADGFVLSRANVPVTDVSDRAGELAFQVNAKELSNWVKKSLGKKPGKDRYGGGGQIEISAQLRKPGDESSAELRHATGKREIQYAAGNTLKKDDFTTLNYFKNKIEDLKRAGTEAEISYGKEKLRLGHDPDKPGLIITGRDKKLLAGKAVDELEKAVILGEVTVNIRPAYRGYGYSAVGSTEFNIPVLSPYDPDKEGGIFKDPEITFAARDKKGNPSEKTIYQYVGSYPNFMALYPKEDAPRWELESTGAELQAAASIPQLAKDKVKDIRKQIKAQTGEFGHYISADLKGSRKSDSARILRLGSTENRDGFVFDHADEAWLALDDPKYYGYGDDHTGGHPLDVGGTVLLPGAVKNVNAGDDSEEVQPWVAMQPAYLTDMSDTGANTRIVMSGKGPSSPIRFTSERDELGVTFDNLAMPMFVADARTVSGDLVTHKVAPGGVLEPTDEYLKRPYTARARSRADRGEDSLSSYESRYSDPIPAEALGPRPESGDYTEGPARFAEARQEYKEKLGQLLEAGAIRPEKELAKVVSARKAKELAAIDAANSQEAKETRERKRKEAVLLYEREEKERVAKRRTVAQKNLKELAKYYADLTWQQYNGMDGSFEGKVPENISDDDLITVFESNLRSDNDYRRDVVAVGEEDPWIVQGAHKIAHIKNLKTKLHNDASRNHNITLKAKDAAGDAMDEIRHNWEESGKDPFWSSEEGLKKVLEDAARKGWLGVMSQYPHTEDYSTVPRWKDRGEPYGFQNAHADIYIDKIADTVKDSLVYRAQEGIKAGSAASAAKVTLEEKAAEWKAAPKKERGYQSALSPQAVKRGDEAAQISQLASKVRNNETFFRGHRQDRFFGKEDTFVSTGVKQAEQFASQEPAGEGVISELTISPDISIYPSVIWWQDYARDRDKAKFNEYDAVPVMEPNGQAVSLAIRKPEKITVVNTNISLPLRKTFGEELQAGKELLAQRRANVKKRIADDDAKARAREHYFGKPKAKKFMRKVGDEWFDQVIAGYDDRGLYHTKAEWERGAEEPVYSVRDHYTADELFDVFLSRINGDLPVAGKDHGGIDLKTVGVPDEKTAEAISHIQYWDLFTPKTGRDPGAPVDNTSEYEKYMKGIYLKKFASHLKKDKIRNRDVARSLEGLIGLDLHKKPKANRKLSKNEVRKILTDSYKELFEKYGGTAQVKLPKDHLKTALAKGFAEWYPKEYKADNLYGINARARAEAINKYAKNHSDPKKFTDAVDKLLTWADTTAVHSEVHSSPGDRIFFPSDYTDLEDRNVKTRKKPYGKVKPNHLYMHVMSWDWEKYPIMPDISGGLSDELQGRKLSAGILKKMGEMPAGVSLRDHMEKALTPEEMTHWINQDRFQRPKGYPGQLSADDESELRKFMSTQGLGVLAGGKDFDVTGYILFGKKERQTRDRHRTDYVKHAVGPPVKGAIFDDHSRSYEEIEYDDSKGPGNRQKRVEKTEHWIVPYFPDNAFTRAKKYVDLDTNDPKRKLVVDRDGFINYKRAALRMASAADYGFPHDNKDLRSRDFITNPEARKHPRSVVYDYNRRRGVDGRVQPNLPYGERSSKKHEDGTSRVASALWWLMPNRAELEHIDGNLSNVDGNIMLNLNHREQTSPSHDGLLPSGMRSTIVMDRTTPMPGGDRGLNWRMSRDSSTFHRGVQVYKEALEDILKNSFTGKERALMKNVIWEIQGAEGPESELAKSGALGLYTGNHPAHLERKTSTVPNEDPDRPGTFVQVTERQELPGTPRDLIRISSDQIFKDPDYIHKKGDGEGDPYNYTTVVHEGIHFLRFNDPDRKATEQHRSEWEQQGRIAGKKQPSRMYGMQHRFNESYRKDNLDSDLEEALTDAETTARMGPATLPIERKGGYYNHVALRETAAKDQRGRKIRMPDPSAAPHDPNLEFDEERDTFVPQFTALTGKDKAKLTRFYKTLSPDIQEELKKVTEKAGFPIRTGVPLKDKGMLVSTDAQMHDKLLLSGYTHSPGTKAKVWKPGKGAKAPMQSEDTTVGEVGIEAPKVWSEMALGVLALDILNDPYGGPNDGNRNHRSGIVYLGEEKAQLTPKEKKAREHIRRNQEEIIRKGLRSVQGARARKRARDLFPHLAISHMKLRGEAEAIDTYWGVELMDDAGNVNKMITHVYNPNLASPSRDATIDTVIPDKVPEGTEVRLVEFRDGVAHKANIPASAQPAKIKKPKASKAKYSGRPGKVRHYTDTVTGRNYKRRGKGSMPKGNRFKAKK